MPLLLVSLALAVTPARLSLGPTSAPPGVAAEWTIDGCVLRVRVVNATNAPIEVDWMRSVYAPAGEAAAAIVPGSSSKMSSMISIPPMVVPPGGFAEETVFRKDRLPSDGNGCLFDVPSAATLTLAVAGGWLTQPMEFAVDAEAERAARVAACRGTEREIVASEKRWRRWSWGAGLGVSAFGTIGMLTAISAEPDERGSVLAAGGVFVAGGAATWGLLQLRANGLEHRRELLGCDRM